MIKKLLFVVILLAIGGVPTAWYLHASADQPTVFRTVNVERGDLLATISSTATIEAEEFVDVGAQVQGMIKSFGTDPADPSKEVDYGTHVEVGTLLAQIDPLIYKTQVEQNKASLESATAQLETAKVNLTLSQKNWDRAQTLFQRKVMNQSDYDAAEANLKTCVAAVNSSTAAVHLSQANLAQATANLAYTTITSPVKGVIVDRRVNIGQTVVASLNAPSLFLLAKDLKRLQLWASVNEADIGQIYRGQKATFTVDAYPHTTFQGTVAQIRLNATMTQNVVTYTVVISTDNSELRLLPYMTANVKFETARRENVLLLPSGALRWLPKPQQVVLEQRDEFLLSSKRHEGSGHGKSKKKAESKENEKAEEGHGKSGEKSAPESGAQPSLRELAQQNAAASQQSGSKAIATGPLPAPKGDGSPRGGLRRGGRHRDGSQRGSAKGELVALHDSSHGDSSQPRHEHARHEQGTVWVDDDGFARSIPVRIGVTDGTKVEIIGGDVKEGMSVIVGEVRHEEGNAETKNPFAPTFFRRGGGSGRPKDAKQEK